jgi:hypothetical protein
VNAVFGAAGSRGDDLFAALGAGDGAGTIVPPATVFFEVQCGLGQLRMKVEWLEYQISLLAHGLTSESGNYFSLIVRKTR